MATQRSTPTSTVRILSWDSLYRDSGVRYGLGPSLCARQAISHIETAVNVVELACGYGRDLAFFSSLLAGVRFVGIEASSAAVELAQHIIPSAEIVNANILGDSWHTSLRAGIVYSNFCYHLFTKEERDLLFERTSRLAKPGGRVIANFISTSDHFFGRGDWIEESTFLVYEDRFWHFFTESEIRHLCQVHGFSILRLEEMTEHEQIDGATNTVTFWYLVAEKDENG